MEGRSLGTCFQMRCARRNIRKGRGGTTPKPGRMIQARTINKALSLQSTTKSWKICGDCNGEENDVKPVRKSFTVRVLWRLTSSRRGFKISTNDTVDNWTFNTIRRRLGGSVIFELCAGDDVTGVRNLLDYGPASVFDTDEISLALGGQLSYAS